MDGCRRVRVTSKSTCLRKKYFPRVTCVQNAKTMLIKLLDCFSAPFCAYSGGGLVGGGGGGRGEGGRAGGSRRGGGNISEERERGGGGVRERGREREREREGGGGSRNRYRENLQGRQIF